MPSRSSEVGLQDVELKRLLDLTDARPFRAFDLDLVNGRRVRVDHPGNLHYFPARENPKEILASHPEPDDYSVVFPGGIRALHVPTAGGGNGNGGPPG